MAAKLCVQNLSGYKLVHEGVRVFMKVDEQGKEW